MTIWEYHRPTLDGDITQALNALGREGWELVTLEKGTGTACVATMKRAISADVYTPEGYANGSWPTLPRVTIDTGRSHVGT